MEPAPPKAYKKPEVIDAWLQDKRDQFKDESPFLKITGQLQEIVAVDLSAGKIFDTRRLKHDGPWGVAFARWLLDTRKYRNAFPDQHHGGDYDVAFFGFNLKPFCRVLGVECNTADFEVPLGLWYANDMCFDPYDMLVEADHGGLWREMFPLSKVVARGGLTLKAYVPGQHPRNDTRVTMELISRFRLVPTLDIANARQILQSKVFSTQNLETAAEQPDDGAASDEAPPERLPPPKKKKKALRKKSSSSS